MGHFLGIPATPVPCLQTQLRFTPWDHIRRETRTAPPAGMLGDFPNPLVALILSSLYGVKRLFHQILPPRRSCDPMGLACRHLRRAAIGAKLSYGRF